MIIMSYFAGLVVMLLSTSLLAGDLKVFPGEGIVKSGQSYCTLKVSHPEGVWLDIDLFESGISEWADENGKDLGKKPLSTMPLYESQPCYLEVSPGAGVHVVTLCSPFEVSSKARSMSVSGEICGNIATRSYSDRVMNIAIRNGTELSIAENVFTVSEVIINEATAKFSIEGTIPGNLEFEKIELLDSWGKRILCSVNGFKTKLPDGSVKYKNTFSYIKSPIESCSLYYLAVVDKKPFKLAYELLVPMKGYTLKQVTPTTTTTTTTTTTSSSTTTTAANITLPPPAAVTTTTTTSTTVPGAESSEQKQKDSSGFWPKLVLTGVTGHGRKGAAIINGRVVMTGGEIDGVKLEYVEENSVLISKDGKYGRIRRVEE